MLYCLSVLKYTLKRMGYKSGSKSLRGSFVWVRNLLIKIKNWQFEDPKR